MPRLLAVPFLVFTLLYFARAAPAPKLSWALETKGFHTKLLISLQSNVQLSGDGGTLQVTFDLLNTFFLDKFEVDQQTDVIALTEGPAPMLPLPEFRLVGMESTYPFDIEAPTFTTPYATNRVTLTVQCAKSSGAESCVAPRGLRLELPIHLRYEDLDAVTPVRVLDLLVGSSYTRRCSLAGSLEASWGGQSRAKSNSEDLCVDVPVGILSHLPFVYWSTMFLLVSAAAGLVLSI
jgi:hypothetical protein